MRKLPDGTIKLDEIDEELLLSMKNMPKGRKELLLLTPSKRIGQRRIETLLEHGLIQRARQGFYTLGRKSKDYIQRLTPSDKTLSIGQDLWDKVSAFIIDKVPTEVYQAVVRLTLSEMRAKQSEIFTNFKNQFNSGWSGVLLAGKPKAMKTPVGELICIIVGLDPEEHKFAITGTKGEFGVPYQGEGGVWKYRPSPWHKKPIVIIDDWHRIIRKDARETALSLAHGSRTFTRYRQTFVNYSIPFIALNTHTKTISETIEKIIKEIGEEYVKRLVVVNVDYIAPYLEDAAILARKMLRSIPKLNFKAFPIKKKELTDAEFSFLCRVLKEATNPDKREFFDERTVELLVLGRYALAKNRDIIGTIYQTCWDRLICLETLEVTKPGWRRPFRKKWKEYISTEQPKILEELNKEEKREDERERKIKRTKEKASQEEVEQLRKSLSFTDSKFSLIAKLRDLIDGLPSPNIKRWQTKLLPFRKKVTRLIDRIHTTRDPQKLEKYQLIYPEFQEEQKKLLKEIKETEEKQEKEENERKDRENRLNRLKASFSKEIKDFKKKLNKFREEEAIEKRKYLDKWLVWIKQVNDLETIESTEKENLPKIKKEVDELIFSLEEKRKQRQAEENRKKEQQKIRDKIQSIVNKKNQIAESQKARLFRRQYLRLEEKVQLNTLEDYQKRKKKPAQINNISVFLQNKKWIKKINLSQEKYQNNMKKIGNTPTGKIGEDVIKVLALIANRAHYDLLEKRFVYLGIDGRYYSLNYFDDADGWGKARVLMQTRIEQIKEEAMSRRSLELLKEWNKLSREELQLMSPRDRDTKPEVKERKATAEEDGVWWRPKI